MPRWLDDLKSRWNELTRKDNAMSERTPEKNPDPTPAQDDPTPNPDREEWEKSRDEGAELQVDDGDEGDPAAEPRREDGRQDDGNDDLTPDRDDPER